MSYPTASKSANPHKYWLYFSNDFIVGKIVNVPDKCHKDEAGFSIAIFLLRQKGRQRLPAVFQLSGAAFWIDSF
ncbi:hypothetical protein D4759_23340 [Clostridiales bacterium AHG0011]|nr:hypothetical protein [Clostridiales bacterium AHG0011]